MSGTQLLPCPFCGNAPSTGSMMDEDIWSHDTVKYTRVYCAECEIGTEFRPPGWEPTPEEAWQARAALSQAGQAAPSESEQSAIADFICKSVAELPDRNSPEDWPEAMLVTQDELCMIVNEALAVPSWPSDSALSDGGAVEKDAARWREWLPFLRRLNRKPYGLAMEIDAIDRASASQGDKP